MGFNDFSKIHMTKYEFLLHLRTLKTTRQIRTLKRTLKISKLYSDLFPVLQSWNLYGDFTIEIYTLAALEIHMVTMLENPYDGCFKKIRIETPKFCATNNMYMKKSVR